MNTFHCLADNLRIEVSVPRWIPKRLVIKVLSTQFVCYLNGEKVKFYEKDPDNYNDRSNENEVANGATPIA